jgi:pimeloyl-ACP methyl ester carboxylesterase
MTRIGPGYDWGRRSPRWAGITSRVVDIGGIRVHYLRAGAEGTGPTHLLIHSMGSGAWSWMDVIGPLSAKGLVIAPDLPGSGRSRPIRRGAGDILAAALFLDDFTVALGIELVVVHGHSMGGLVGGIAVPDGYRRRWLNPLRALQLEQRTPGRSGSGSPPRTSGSWWSAARSPRRTGCASRCQPGQRQPCAATWASTVRFASLRQAEVRRAGWSGVRRKRLAKPGRPQRSQRRSFVVSQPQEPM